MVTKLIEGDTVSMQGEVMIVHADGSMTVRVHGLHYPVTIGSEHLVLVAKKKAAQRTGGL
jgi:hypothetical protein